MAFEDKAFVGRDVTVYAALEDSSTPPADGNFTALAATRGLEYGAEWDTADTTARGTGTTRTALVTFKNNNISIDGLVLLDNAFQLAVRDHIDNPPAAMSGQPRAWLRLVEPRDGGATVIFDYPVILSSFRVSASYENEATYSMEAQAQGDPVKTEVPAP